MLSERLYRAGPLAQTASKGTFRLLAAARSKSLATAAVVARAVLLRLTQAAAVVLACQARAEMQPITQAQTLRLALLARMGG